MDHLYREHILDHYHHPRCFGKMEKPDVSESRDNPLCGDQIGIDIVYSHDKKGEKTIGSISFYGEGCAISIASASLLCEHVTGKAVQDVKQMKGSDVVDLLGIMLTPTRMKCALLSLEVLHRVLAKSDIDEV